MENNVSQEEIVVRIVCIIRSLLKHIGTILIVFMIFGMAFDVYKTMHYVPHYRSSLTATLSGEKNTYSNLSNIEGYLSTFNYALNSQNAKSYVMNKLGKNSLDLTVTTTQSTGNMIIVSATSNRKEATYHALDYLMEWYNNNQDRFKFPYRMTLIEKDSFVENSINPNSHIRNVGMAGLIGAAICIVYFILQSLLKGTAMTSTDVKQKVKTRLYSRLPHVYKRRGILFWRKNRSALLITSLKTPFDYKEAVHKLAGKVERSAQHHQYKTFMVTSTLENEGKSSVAVNLALSLAQQEKRVLIIDADIRNPSIQKILNLKDTSSLNDYLSGKKEWTDVVEYLEKYHLFVLKSHQDLDNVYSLISNGMLDKMLVEAKKVFDYIIVDVSPSYQLIEPMIINESIDATLYVVTQDEAPIEIINETITRLNNVNNNVIGVVYNQSVKDFSRRHKAYGHRYGYGRYRHGEER